MLKVVVEYDLFPLFWDQTFFIIFKKIQIVGINPHPSEDTFSLPVLDMSIRYLILLGNLERCMYTLSCKVEKQGSRSIVIPSS